MPSANYHKFKHLLSDPEEQVLNTLGNRAAEAFAENGRFNRSFALLTDKRICFKGKCRIRTKQDGTYRKSAYAVKLQDVTGSDTVNLRSLPIRIIAKLFFVLALVITCWEIYHLLNGTLRASLVLNIVIPWLLALIFALFDRLLTCRLFKVSFAGGSVALDLGWISSAEAEAFQKTLSRVLEQHNE